MSLDVLMPDPTGHWCLLCALDGISPPPDPVAEAKRAKREQTSARLSAAREARKQRELQAALEAARDSAEQRQRRELAKLAAQRRADREASAPGFSTPQQLADRWAYYGGRCWMCHDPAVHMDHVKPLAAGGSNWPSNQRPACWPCNFRKGAIWPFRLTGRQANAGPWASG